MVAPERFSSYAPSNLPGEERSVTNARIKAVVMLTVLAAWLIYFVSGVVRGQAVEVWTWGIPVSVYGALYQPWVGRHNAGGTPPPGRPRIGGGAPTEQEAEDSA